MRKFTGFILLLVLLAAGSALAVGSGLAMTLKRTYAGAPNDADPNSGTPVAKTNAAVFDTGDNYTVGDKTEQVKGWLFTFDNDGTTYKCDVTPWVYDNTTTKWIALAKTTQVAKLELHEELTVGPSFVYWQLTGCTGTFGTFVKLYAAAR